MACKALPDSPRYRSGVIQSPLLAHCSSLVGLKGFTLSVLLTRSTPPSSHGSPPLLPPLGLYSDVTFSLSSSLTTLLELYH